VNEPTQQPTDLFLSLTPDRVLLAVESAGLRCTGLCYALNSFENRVYEVELTDASRVVAKFYRPGRWSAEQILEEHRFLIELEQAEIPVCPVRPFPDGETLHHTAEGVWYSLADRRGGRAPDELDDDTMIRLGRLVGRMHVIGAASDAPSRLRLQAETFIREHLRYHASMGIIPARLLDRYSGLARDVAAVVDERMRGVAVHRLHGDLHLGNLLFRTGVLHVLDFDDMVVGPAAQDMWLVLPGRDAYATGLRDKFLSGYEEFRSFDRTTLRLIEPLRAMRMIHYAAWLARRWHDPVFPITWPHFGTEAYWEEATTDLQQALGLIATEGGPPRQDDGGDLTNEDFFWDL
jgi:Ser/Thr protein kinase RdoA (MazF antagonist)